MWTPYLPNLSTFLQPHTGLTAKLSHFQICHSSFFYFSNKLRKYNSFVPSRKKYLILHCNQSIHSKGSQEWTTLVPSIDTKWTTLVTSIDTKWTTLWPSIDTKYYIGNWAFIHATMFNLQNYIIWDAKWNFKQNIF